MSTVGVVTLDGRRVATAEPSSRLHPLVMQFVVAMIFAFGFRAWQFGSPIIQIDEQFYLVVGERILHGAVPFVDIWDRKPVGTFLVYAALRLLGGEGIVAYQVGATTFAGLTAFLISAMALRVANARGAALAGCAYIVWLTVFDGSGGQTPVFYNAFVAGAAIMVLNALDRSAGRNVVLLSGIGGMLLIGLALQIKYSAVFEGMFFGCVLLWRWTRDAVGKRILPLVAVAWAGSAMLPTLAVWAWYADHGYNDAFVYANFLSIFDRSGWPAPILATRLAGMVGLASPLLLCAWLERGSAHVDPNDDVADARRFAMGWLGAALAGVLVFGTYFIHYFLPALVPLCLVCARVLGDRTASVSATVAGRQRIVGLAAFVAATAVVALVMSVPKRLTSRGSEASVRDVAAAIASHRTGCMFVYDGEPILYHLTSACTVTTHLFPNHLNDASEEHATGIDPKAEVRRILDVERPDIIVTSDRPDPHNNVETLLEVEAALRKHYELVYRRKIGSRDRLVYKRLTGSGLPDRGPEEPGRM